MGEKLIIGPINHGLRNDRTAFVIDNDSFPTLINAYQWRGRVKRKRGTSLLNRLTRVLPTASIGTSGVSPWSIINIYSTYTPPFTPETDAQIKPGSVVITIQAGPDIVFTDQGNGTLTSPTAGNSGTINYTTGNIVLIHTAGAGVASTAKFQYFPNLPVMGLEEFFPISEQYPGTIAFDTKYSYRISTTYPYNIYNVNFYKNLITATYTGYIQKTTWTPTTWNGQDYQQFWTTNYQGAMWATNGVTTPFSITNIGMQYKAISGINVTSLGPPAIATINIVGHGLVVGDFLFINEVNGLIGINFQTGYVISVVDANNVSVEFPNATMSGAWSSGGIAQYLTSRADTTLDGIRWYDGDPVDSVGNFSTGKGWVNFSPPLSQDNFSISDLPAAKYYLVGAKMIVPFKDRLLFIGPVIQTSTAGSQKYLPDTVIYSQNGTPYYTASYTNTPSAVVDTPTSATNVFNPILVPVNQTGFPSSFFEDQTGFGGYIEAGLNQTINTVSSNEDVLIMGFDKIQARFVYSGNDIVPFNFFVINSELGSASTFSIINMDEGALTRGSRGFTITSQTAAKRIDLDIPDEVFEIKLTENGSERVTAERDYINEWAYFTYPSNSRSYKFPNQTLQYNYRDNSWGIFYECYTTYGSFQKNSGFTWATVGGTYPTWGSWNAPWNSSQSTALQPLVIAGNQQGFVLFRDSSTDEDNSLYIKDIASGTVTSPNHCLNTGDYIIISGSTGTISTQVNDNIFSVRVLTSNTFTLNPPISTGTYTGAGVIKRMYVPIIQTKQFPMAWGMGRKTRIGTQQYLLTTTDDSQITLLIFLSQNSDSAYNQGPIVPDTSSTNRGLIYSTILYTCTESSNLGLTPANTNLQMLSVINSAGDNASSPQSQIWHRINTSLIGDTVQIGFTLSDTQMRAVDEEGVPISQFSEIELHSICIDCSPSQWLS